MGPRTRCPPERAESSALGVAIAVTSLVVLPGVAVWKVRLAARSASRAMRGDGVLTGAAAVLAFVTLLALVFDNVVRLVVVRRGRGDPDRRVPRERGRSRAAVPGVGAERFTATGSIRRSDFGIDFGIIPGAEKLMLGDKVKIELDLQFVAP